MKLNKNINYKLLSLYLKYGYISLPGFRTIYKNRKINKWINPPYKTNLNTSTEEVLLYMKKRYERFVKKQKQKGKYILKKVAERYLPKKFVWNPVKLKLPAPISNSFNEGKLKRLYIDKINDNSKISDYYNINGLKKLIKMHDGTDQTINDHSNTLSRILSLEIWLNSVI